MRHALLLILALALVLALGLELPTASSTETTETTTLDDGCPGQAFPWGGRARCWSRDDGDEFTSWLRAHGSTPARFATNYAQLADVFREPWPPPRAPERPCHSSSCARAVIRAVFPDWVENYAVAVAGCETGQTFSPGAIGDSGNSLGLFQVHWPSWGGLPWVGSREQLLEAWHNSRVALRISGNGTSWSHWTCA